MHPKKSGFTLIELSVVIIVIGLVASGILVGRDMIEAATIRKQVAQIKNFSAAVNTFRTKYNGFPGDLLASEADSFGLISRAGTTGRGDGNSLIESCDSGSGLPAYYQFGCETALFWSDLGQSALIGALPGPYEDAPIVIPQGEASKYLPDAALGNAHIAVFSLSESWDDGRTCRTPFCFAIAKITSTFVNGTYGIEGTVSPGRAYIIDSKIDDGLPHNGNTRATIYDTSIGVSGLAAQMFTVVPAWGTCLKSDGAGDFIYDTSPDAFNKVPGCIVNINHE